MSANSGLLSGFADQLRSSISSSVDLAFNGWPVMTEIEQDAVSEQRE
jgi:hypothetical protein